jgi:hypothetical protein
MKRGSALRPSPLLNEARAVEERPEERRHTRRGCTTSSTQAVKPVVAPISAPKPPVAVPGSHKLHVPLPYRPIGVPTKLATRPTAAPASKAAVGGSNSTCIYESNKVLRFLKRREQFGGDGRGGERTSPLTSARVFTSALDSWTMNLSSLLAECPLLSSVVLLGFLRHGDVCVGYAFEPSDLTFTLLFFKVQAKPLAKGPGPRITLVPFAKAALFQGANEEWCKAAGVTAASLLDGTHVRITIWEAPSDGTLVVTGWMPPHKPAGSVRQSRLPQPYFVTFVPDISAAIVTAWHGFACMPVQFTAQQDDVDDFGGLEAEFDDSIFHLHSDATLTTAFLQLPAYHTSYLVSPPYPRSSIICFCDVTPSLIQSSSAFSSGCKIYRLVVNTGDGMRLITFTSSPAGRPPSLASADVTDAAAIEGARTVRQKVVSEKSRSNCRAIAQPMHVSIIDESDSYALYRLKLCLDRPRGRSSLGSGPSSVSSIWGTSASSITLAGHGMHMIRPKDLLSHKLGYGMFGHISLLDSVQMDAETVLSRLLVKGSKVVNYDLRVVALLDPEDDLSLHDGLEDSPAAVQSKGSGNMVHFICVFDAEVPTTAEDSPASQDSEPADAFTAPAAPRPVSKPKGYGKASKLSSVNSSEWAAAPPTTAAPASTPVGVPSRAVVRSQVTATFNACTGQIHIASCCRLPVKEQPAFDTSRMGCTSLSGLTSLKVEQQRTRLFPASALQHTSMPRELTNDAVLQAKPITKLVHPLYPMVLLATR